jgi:hypothetical protein
MQAVPLRLSSSDSASSVEDAQSKQVTRSDHQDPGGTLAYGNSPITRICKMGNRPDAPRSSSSVASPHGNCGGSRGIGLDRAVRCEHAAHVDQGSAHQRAQLLQSGKHRAGERRQCGAQHLRGPTASRPDLGPARLLRRHIGTHAHLAPALRQPRAPVRHRPIFHRRFP